MPKLKDAEISQQDIADYLRTKDDFGFETAVFHDCVSEGLIAEHGGTYQDPVTRKDRQFDIRGYTTNKNRVVRLAIECKNLSKNYPLVVSCVPLIAKEKYQEIILSGERESHPLVSTIWRAETHRLTGSYCMFSQAAVTGKSTTQIGKSTSDELVGGDAEVFEKWSQAIASAHELVEESADDHRLVNDKVAATLILPVLVVSDGTLWTAQYSEEGASVGSPQAADECIVYLGKAVSSIQLNSSYTFSHLLVFTRTKFRQYLHRLTNDSDYWADALFADNKMVDLFDGFRKLKS